VLNNSIFILAKKLVNAYGNIVVVVFPVGTCHNDSSFFETLWVFVVETNIITVGSVLSVLKFLCHKCHSHKFHKC
jgi:hypothetical protein